MNLSPHHLISIQPTPNPINTDIIHRDPIFFPLTTAPPVNATTLPFPSDLPSLPFPFPTPNPPPKPDPASGEGPDVIVLLSTRTVSEPTLRYDSPKLTSTPDASVIAGAPAVSVVPAIEIPNNDEGAVTMTAGSPLIVAAVTAAGFMTTGSGKLVSRP